MNVDKEMLHTTEDKLEKLDEMGVTFIYTSQDEARKYIENNNYFFKLISYRKNYDKNDSNENKGKYIKLDFKALQELARIDMHARYIVSILSANIEHYLKLRILVEIEKIVDNKGNFIEDGYQIVERFLLSLDEKRIKYLNSEIIKNYTSVYCGELIRHYEEKRNISIDVMMENEININSNYPIYQLKLPVWVLLEVISFGSTLSFYKFFLDEYNKDDKLYYMLKSCQKIRNAAAHSNCMFNNLRTPLGNIRPPMEIMNKISMINDITEDERHNKMHNERIQYFITLLYVHNNIVTSQGVKDRAIEDIKKFSKILKDKMHYFNNELVENSLGFIIKVIDNWYK